MRIGVYAPMGNAFVETWPRAHVVGELRDEGHSVEHINPVIGIKRYGTAAEYSEWTLRYVRRTSTQTPFDLFFAIAADVNLAPDAVGEISRTVPTLLMCSDDMSVPFEYKHVAPRFALTWATSHEGHAVLKKYGANAFMMPYAANPYVFRPFAVKTEAPSVCFVGRSYGVRTKYLSSLAEAGVVTRLYGKSPADIYSGNGIARTPLARAFKRSRAVASYVKESLKFPIGRRCVRGALVRSVHEAFGHPIGRSLLTSSVEQYPGPDFERVGRTFSENALSLGSMELHSTFVLQHPIMCVHLREFEAPMCGAVHLTNRCTEILDYFEEGKEILCYGSEEELVAVAREFTRVNRAGDRRRIRQAARKRALADHTWSRRLQQACAQLGLPWRRSLSEALNR